ncbi:MAG: macro domain-containing protein [Methylococcaceae bacterium]|nr:macro domain-containing protein [Methylococcaceae bacterium]
MSKLETKILFDNNSQFIISSGDLLGAPVDAIVNPANSGLAHGGGLAAQILFEAGEALEAEGDKIIAEQGLLAVCSAVATTAGRLPYKAVIHAVGPRNGCGDEQAKIEQTVANCLQLAEQKRYDSIAFPAISSGIFAVPKELCAQAFKNAVTSYFANDQHRLKNIYLCLLTDDYPVFTAIINSSEKQSSSMSTAEGSENEGDVNEINLEDLMADEEIPDWL